MVVSGCVGDADTAPENDLADDANLDQGLDMSPDDGEEDLSLLTSTLRIVTTVNVPDASLGSFLIASRNLGPWTVRRSFSPRLPSSIADSKDPSARGRELLQTESHLRSNGFHMFLYWHGTGAQGDWRITPGASADAMRAISSRGRASW